MINPEIPAAISASIVSAKAGRAPISAKIVLPAGTVWYIVFPNNVPVANNIGIATMRATDHLPSVVSGAILQDCSAIPFTSIAAQRSRLPPAAQGKCSTLSSQPPREQPATSTTKSSRPQHHYTIPSPGRAGPLCHLQRKRRGRTAACGSVTWRLVSPEPSTGKRASPGVAPSAQAPVARPRPSPPAASRLCSLWPHLL